jgi:hypothetical protein
VYNQKDFDRNLVLEKRTELVARKLTEFLAATGVYSKTIVFCEDIDHAERMRQALVNANPELCAKNRKYVMRITGDSDEGKAELDPFMAPEERYPVIVTTSKLMTTGVDAANLPGDRAGPNHPVDDRVQANHRSWHAHPGGFRQALLHHPRFQEGHRAVCRPRLRR